MTLRWLIALILMLGLLSSAFVSASTVPDDTYVVHQEDDDDDDEDQTTGNDDEDTEDETDDEEVIGDDDGEENDEDDEEVREAYEREVEISQNARELKIESELKNGETKDEFAVEFKVGGGDEPEIKLEYSTESDTAESELEYRVEFDQIIEFNETSTTVGYDENDTIVSSYELDKADWNDIVYTTTETSTGTLYTARATTADGVFSLILHVAGTFTELDGSLVTPNSIKIDVEIHDYPYQSDASYLALETDVKSEAEYEEEQDTDEEQMGFSSNEAQISIGNNAANGFFSWVEIASADGVEVSVISSGLLSEDHEEEDDLFENEQKGVMYFTFDAQNAKDIIWDPKVGVVSEASLQVLSDLLAQNDAVPAQLPGFGLMISIIGLLGVAIIASGRVRRISQLK